jgi:hypothetical protein
MAVLKYRARDAFAYACVPPLARSPLSHTSVTSIVFPQNSDTLLFVAAVLGYSVVPIRWPRIRTPNVSAHLGCAAQLLYRGSEDLID